MKFSIKDFFSKCDQIRRKLFLCSDGFILKKAVDVITGIAFGHIPVTVEIHVVLFTGSL